MNPEQILAILLFIIGIPITIWAIIKSTKSKKKQKSKQSN